MKLVYDLAIALAQNPKRVADTQALTLNAEKPYMGLAGKYGLYGSDEWWKNLCNETIPRIIYEGPIIRLHSIGMHNETPAFTITVQDGQTFTYDLMAHIKSDLELYRIGRIVRVTLFNEIKKTGDPLEMLWTVEIGDA